MAEVINFSYNPTSTVGPGKLIPGGMADALVQPILPHLLPGTYEVTDAPQPNRVNVYYCFPDRYRQRTPIGTSVFVSHGIADKNWRNASKVNRFDYVFVSGPAWTARMREGRARTNVIEAGYTKLDPIFNGLIPDSWPARDGRVRVLWAPTHGGGGERYRHATEPPNKPGAKRSTYWHRDTIRDLLPESEFVVREALHPRHRPDGRSTLDEYVGADVVVADGGSTIYEAMALDLPVVFPAWLVFDAMTVGRTTFEATIYRDRIGRHASKPGDLPRLCVDAASGITGAEQAFIEPILPRAYRGESGRLHAESLSDIAAGGAVRHGVIVRGRRRRV